MAEDYPRHTYRMEGEGLDKVCAWSLGGDNSKCPHPRETRDHKMKIKDSILDCVGNTPMIRLNNIMKAEGIECDLLAKAEFLNPGGSVKDRIGRRMVLDAEKEGRIKKGDIIVEPTSGNTGVGLSMAAAARGYRMIITMPEKMSQEKNDALKGLGATVIRTPTSYAFDHAKCHIGIAIELTKTLENCHCLDQYKNTGNPMAHYEETGQEIWDQTEGKVDYVFLGAGTGGTLTGISRKLKEMNPNIKIVAIDPEGSILAQPESLNGPGPEGGQQIEGIGYDFIPRVCDRTQTDYWIKGPDKPSYLWARRLMREEGLMCGGSSGTAMWGAVKFIKENNIGAGKKCVVLLPDNIRNYMTKHLNDDWMYERGYITEEQCAKNAVSDLIPNEDWGQDMTIGDLTLPDAKFVEAEMKIGEVINLFQSSGFAQYPVREASGKITGCVTKVNLMNQLVKQRVTKDDPVSAVTKPDLRHMSKSMTLSELGRVLTRNKFALVEKTKFVTVSDLMQKLSPPKPKGGCCATKKCGPKPAAAPEESSTGMMQMAAAAVIGMGVGVTALFLAGKNK